MINPILQNNTMFSYKQSLKKLSFKEGPIVSPENQDFFQLNSDVKPGNESTNSKQQNNFLISYIATTVLISSIIGGLVYLYRNKPKDALNISDYAFKSLRSDPQVPKLDNCKSINGDLKQILKHQLRLANADKEIFEEAGKPEAANRFLLSGPPGVGKTYFSKVYAKTLDAEYMEVLFSDLNSRWVGEVEEKMSNLFKKIIYQAKAKPDKKYVVTFNEIDSILLPVEQLTGGSGSTHFATLRRERSTFLTYIDKLQSETPNVTVIGTTNLSPQNRNLDAATMSRFQNVTEISYPNKESLYEAIKENLGKIKGKDKFISENDENLKNLAQTMAERQFSFRNLEYVVNEAKSSFLDEKINNRNIDFKFEYLDKAQKSLHKTDGEREISKNFSK